MSINKVIKLFRLLFCDKYRSALISNRVAAGVEHEKLLSYLDCKSIIDIGANRGQFALVARHCFPDSKIISFEPLPGPSSVFKMVFAGDTNITLKESAIGPDIDQVEMHVSARDDSSSLLSLTSKQSEIFPGTHEVSSVKVSVAPLATFVSVDDLVGTTLLKIDVQGFELEVLKGCETLLDSFKYVYVECSFIELYEGQALAHEVIRFLEQHEFSLIGIYNTYYDDSGLAVQADFLFKKN